MAGIAITATPLHRSDTNSWNLLHGEAKSQIAPWWREINSLQCRLFPPWKEPLPKFGNGGRAPPWGAKAMPHHSKPLARPFVTRATVAHVPKRDTVSLFALNLRMDPPHGGALNMPDRHFSKAVRISYWFSSRFTRRAIRR